MSGSWQKLYLGVVSFRAGRALILSYTSTNIQLTATAAFIHCVYFCYYEGMRDSGGLRGSLPRRPLWQNAAKSMYVVSLYCWRWPKED